MALRINKEDIDRKEADNPSSKVSNVGGGNFMEGINKFMGNLNTTIDNAGNLLGKFRDIKDRLGGKTENNTPPMKSINEPPPIPQPPPPPPPKPAEFKEITKREKAETIFNKLHEQVKPQIPKLSLINGNMILEWALKPDNKEKVIKAIEGLL